MTGKIAAAMLGVWLGIRPFRALAADPAAVPIDLAVYLSLIALVAGSVLTLVALTALQARRMRRKRASKWPRYDYCYGDLHHLTELRGRSEAFFIDASRRVH